MIKAFVLCSVGTGEYLGLSETAREIIEKMPEVVRAYNVFGRFDVIAEVKVEGLKELSRLVADRIRAVSGVRATETFICYSTKRRMIDRPSIERTNYVLSP